MLPTIPILYRDENYFIVNKPYDCRIQDPSNEEPSGQENKKTLAKSDSEPVQSILEKEHPLLQFRNVHQLDYATSGIYVLALTKLGASQASKLFRERRVKKQYLALVHGHMAEDAYDIDEPIGNDPHHDFCMAIISSGKPAQTKVQTILRAFYTFNDATTGEQKRIPVTKVSLSPITGRRHQLRVHLQHIGYPIVGDFNYEKDYTNTFRMMLHAHKIALPLLNQEITVQADDPFENLLT